MMWRSAVILCLVARCFVAASEATSDYCWSSLAKFAIDTVVPTRTGGEGTQTVSMKYPDVFKAGKGADLLVTSPDSSWVEHDLGSSGVKGTGLAKINCNSKMKSTFKFQFVYAGTTTPFPIPKRMITFYDIDSSPKGPEKFTIDNIAHYSTPDGYDTYYKVPMDDLEGQPVPLTASTVSVQSIKEGVGSDDPGSVDDVLNAEQKSKAITVYFLKQSEFTLEVDLTGIIGQGAGGRNIFFSFEPVVEDCSCTDSCTATAKAAAVPTKAVASEEMMGEPASEEMTDEEIDIDYNEWVGRYCSTNVTEHSASHGGESDCSGICSGDPECTGFHTSGATTCFTCSSGSTIATTPSTDCTLYTKPDWETGLSRFGIEGGYTEIAGRYCSTHVTEHSVRDGKYDCMDICTRDAECTGFHARSLVKTTCFTCTSASDIAGTTNDDCTLYTKQVSPTSAPTQVSMPSCGNMASESTAVCPSGAYQSQETIFDCTQLTNCVRQTVQKDTKYELAKIYPGATQLSVTLRATGDVNLLMQQGGQCIVGAAPGCKISDRCKTNGCNGFDKCSDLCHDHADQSIYFSGDDRQQPVEERISIDSVRSQPVTFSVLSYHDVEISAVFSWENLSHCDAEMPLGCSICTDFKGCPSGKIAVCNGSKDVQCSSSGSSNSLIMIFAILVAIIIAALCGLQFMVSKTDAPKDIGVARELSRDAASREEAARVAETAPLQVEAKMQADARMVFWRGKICFDSRNAYAPFSDTET